MAVVRPLGCLRFVMADMYRRERELTSFDCGCGSRSFWYEANLANWQF